MKKEIELAIIAGKPEGKVQSFTEESISIGRAEDSDFVVDDGHASKINCRIILENDQFFVVDNHSTNGTFLNDDPIERALLKSGDLVRVGETIFEFRCKKEEQPEEDKTVILPQEQSPGEDATVILPNDQDRPPADVASTVIVTDEADQSGTADPEATRIAPLDPEATQIAPLDPNATQIAPAVPAKGKVKKPRKKKATGESPLKRLASLDKTAKLRLLIVALVVLVLMMFGAALLMPSPKPPAQSGSAQATAPQQGDASSEETDASLPVEAKIQKARQMLELGKSRYEERFLKPGSLHEAIQYFEKAESYLSDVSPKPALYDELEQLNLKAKETLQDQFNTLRLDAYMLIRKKNYKEARTQLEAILKLVPDPNDERHKLAQNKLKEIRSK